MSDFFEAPSLEYLGQHLPQYAFEDFIAQGGMGAVYRARQISLDRVVAIKILPHELGQNEEFRESFSKEAKAMAKVNHPNLIGVFDSGDVDGMPYIVMEYIEGSSLHDFCWGEKIEAEKAAAITMGICEGLANAHQHGIIHRDIKPANILLTDQHEPKIGDFGLAHPSDSEETGLIMGTPGYTAPEIFEDANLAGVLADQYSVGMILHQMITGIDPAGTEGPPTQASGRIRLDAIWRKATQLDPAQRYPSVAHMAEDLKKWIESRAAKSAAAPGRALAAPAPGRALKVGTQSMGRASVRPVMPVKSSSGILVKLIMLGLFAAVAWYGYGYYKTTQQNKGGASDDGQPGIPGTPGTPSPHAPSSGLPGTKPAPQTGGVSNPGTKPKPRPKPVVPSPTIPDPTVPPGPRTQLPPGDPALRDKAVALILNARKTRDAQLKRNAREFQRLLEREAATAASSDAKAYDRIRRQCDDGWIPGPNEMPDLNAELTRAYRNAHKEQRSIAAKHNIELRRIRNHYVPNLEEAANSTSDPQLKKRLLAQAAHASNLNRWVADLAPE